MSVREALLYLRSGILPERMRGQDEVILEYCKDDVEPVVIVNQYGKVPDRVDAGTKSKHGRFTSIHTRHGRFTSIQSTDTSEGRHPGRKISYGGRKNVLSYEQDLTPSAMSPVVVDDRLPAAFF